MENNMTREELLKIVDTYYAQYNLPELKMSIGDWDAVLNILERHIPNATGAINIVLKKAFNTSLLNSDGYFNLYYIILALDDLIVFNISNDEVNTIKNEIMLESLKNNTKKELSITK